MSLLTGQELIGSRRRTYHVQVPDDPAGPTVPVIIVFHGGGQDAITIAKRWYVDPPNPMPADLAGYLLVFPETDPLMDEGWVHFSALNTGFPRLDLVFVEELLTELADRDFATTSASVPLVRADVGLAYAAGFSNGGGMVWQLLNSALAASFRGFAAVGMALDPEKVQHYRNELAATGEVPAPAPVVYVHGTADRTYRPTFMQEETELDQTLPFFTVTEMLQRNGVPAHRPGEHRAGPGQYRRHRGRAPGVSRRRSVPAGHGHQRWPQLADAHHARQPAGGRALRRHPDHRGVLAEARRPPLTRGPGTAPDQSTGSSGAQHRRDVLGHGRVDRQRVADGRVAHPGLQGQPDQSGSGRRRAGPRMVAPRNSSVSPSTRIRSTPMVSLSSTARVTLLIGDLGLEHLAAGLPGLGQRHPHPAQRRVGEHRVRRHPTVDRTRRVEQDLGVLVGGVGERPVAVHVARGPRRRGPRSGTGRRSRRSRARRSGCRGRRAGRSWSAGRWPAAGGCRSRCCRRPP